MNTGLLRQRQPSAERLLYVSAGTTTNNGTLTITDSLYGGGKFLQGSGATLYYNSANPIGITTFDPSATNNTVYYNYAGAQTIKASNSINYYNLTCSVSGNKTMGNNTNVLNNLTVQNTATLDADASNNRNLVVNGNWTITSTDPDPFREEQGTVTFSGTSGVQAITTVLGMGETFYDVVFNNTSGSNPSITTSKNINVSDNTTFTSGILDLQGKNYIITGGATNTKDQLNSGKIITSVPGSYFTVTDPNSTKIIYFNGTAIGSSANGITINTNAGRIQFQNFTEYGTASFTKTLNTDDVFGGGNYYHGPVTFTAANSASRWRMGDNSAVPDTFYNATFNAYANGGANNNFIICANSIGNAFYGTTKMSSTTVGGFYICRDNGTGNASATFYGPVIDTIQYSGNLTFADAASGNINSVTFNSTITLNSTVTSTGDYHFADNNKYGTVVLNNGGQFLTGSINGQTNVYMCNVTQYGTLTQTLNTAGSTGALYIGGTTSLPSYECIFNGPCSFSADTAGYFVGCEFNGNTSININHANANGYIVSDTFADNCTAIVGDIRFQKNIFNGTTSLQHTSSFNSTSNGGNTFNGATTITNSGTAILRQGGYSGLGDSFNGSTTFVQNGAGATLQPAYGATSNFAGNISTSGSTGTAITFASGTNGNMTINGNGTQAFSNGGSPIPSIVNLTMSTASPTNILQFNFSTSVTGTLTLTQGLINLNNNSLTLGASAADPGTLSYTSGWLYGGTFTRWFAKTAVSMPNTTGLFPVGSDPIQNVYHPLWFGFTTNLTTGGTLSVNHTPTGAWYTPVSYYDASWTNSVQGVSIAAWVVSTANGLALNGSTGQLRFGGYGFGVFILSDLNASLPASAVATFSAATNTIVPLEVTRNSLSLANLSNTWHIGTKDISGSPLPIQLLAFNAQPNSNNAVDITWSTADEINNKIFTVERTRDGITFDTVAKVAGVGNSSQTVYYNALDEAPYAGTSYYRLQQTDFDGKYTFSGMVPVNISNKEALNIMPNPAHSKMVFSYNNPSAGTVGVLITDALGKVVYAANADMQQGSNSYTVNLTGYAAGTYFLRITGNGSANTLKFIVE